MTVRKLVELWDSNNGICLLADHREDLIARIEKFSIEAAQQTLNAVKSRVDELQIELDTAKVRP